MEKVSAAQVDTVMIKAASALRGLHAENATLRAEIARRDRISHAEKIASAAIDRGVMEEDVAAAWASDMASSDEDLEMVERFSARMVPGVSLGQTFTEKTASVGAAETDCLTDFLLSSDL